MTNKCLIYPVIAGTTLALLWLAWSNMTVRAMPPPVDANVTIRLELQPDVSNEICFLRNLPSPQAFCLADGDSEYITGILGLLDVHVVNTAGIWHVKSIDCEPDIPAIATVLSTGTMFVPVNAGDELECVVSAEFLGVPPTAVPTSTATPSPTATPTLPATATPTVVPAVQASATPVPSSTPVLAVFFACPNGGPVINLLKDSCPVSLTAPATLLSGTAQALPSIRPPSTGDAGLR